MSMKIGENYPGCSTEYLEKVQQKAEPVKEMEKVNSLMAQAQNRMGQVEDREATPEEENMFAMASLM